MPDSDPFFIGWLPMPPAYRRFLIPVSAALLALAAVVAATVALLQRDAGGGRWEPVEETIDGVAFAQPYAMLLVPGDPPSTMLLVESGKFGALERVRTLTDGAGQGVPVRVTGTRLHRDGRSMLELAPGERGLVRLSEADARPLRPLSRPPTEPVTDAVTLHGEIIDPKCYLGAMKPGGGKTHKACAMLCIAGGIPPMLVTPEAYYLLVTDEGEAANAMLLPYVGDTVRLRGTLERRGDMWVMRVSPGGVSR